MNRLFMLLFLLAPLTSAAQESPFVFDDLRLLTRLDVYGVEEQVLTGSITNASTDAFAGVSISGEVISAAGEPLGEVFGYTANACGVELPDDTLQQEETATFTLPVDWFSAPAAGAPLPEDFALTAAGERMPAYRDTPPAGMTGVTMLSSDEVVAVDWAASDVLLYGVGCDQKLFTTYEWRRYDLTSGERTRLPAHPNTTFITPELIDATTLQNPTANPSEVDPALLERSHLEVVPNTTRVLWQNDRNDLFSAERVGAANRRLVHRYLHRHSLRGFLFTPEQNVLAYYFGAYGEPVRYITFTADGRLISQVITKNPMSVTVPGVWYDGQRVIISGTFDGVTGYFNQFTTAFNRELLFEVAPEELPGNHFPAPAYFRRDLQTRYIYIIRPLDGQPWLQCFHFEARTLHDLTPLPLQLETDERAWSWLSPDGTRLAVSANGRHAGLWLVDLTAFGDACPPAAR